MSFIILQFIFAFLGMLFILIFNKLNNKKIWYTIYFSVLIGVLLFSIFMSYYVEGLKALNWLLPAFVSVSTILNSLNTILVIWLFKSKKSLGFYLLLLMIIVLSIFWEKEDIFYLEYCFVFMFICTIITSIVLYFKKK